MRPLILLFLLCPLALRAAVLLHEGGETTLKDPAAQTREAEWLQNISPSETFMQGLSRSVGVVSSEGEAEGHSLLKKPAGRNRFDWLEGDDQGLAGKDKAFKGVQDPAALKALAKARELYGRDRVEEALKLLDELQETNPENPFLLILSASMHKDLGHYSEAIRQAREAARLVPAHPLPLSLLGVSFLASGQYDRAETVYRQMLTTEDGAVQAHQMLGTLYCSRGDFKQGALEYGKVLEKRPDLTRTWYQLGLALRESGQPANAVKAFTMYLRHDPESAEAYNELAVALILAKQEGEALKALGKALKLNPRLHQGYANLGVLLASNGQRRKAIGYWLRALDIKLDDVQSWLNLVRALDPIQASADDREAGHAPPKIAYTAHSHYQDALAAVERADVENAQHHFVQALLLDLNNPEYFNGIGTLLAAHGHGEIAAPFFKAALLLHPGFDTARGNLQMLQKEYFAQHGAPFMKELEQDLQAHPQDAQRHFDWALRVAKAFGTVIAIPWFEKALALEEDNLGFRIALSKALSLTGFFKQAMETFAPVYGSDEENPHYQHRMAWLMLRAEGAGKAEYQAALKLARKASEQSRSLDHLQSLAHACMMSGEFEEGLQTAQRSLELARQRGMKNQASRIRWQIETLRRAQAQANQE